MKLSLCIATYNEEENIHYPLESALDLVDEVVIVDGGSTDSTIKKAKSYGRKVKVYEEKYEKMFHINKQKALDKAKGEWILQLDADEALSKELKEEINSFVILNEVKNLTRMGDSRIRERSFVANAPQDDKNIVAYQIPRKNFFLTRFLTKGGQYPDYTVRLYKNGAARFPMQSVHENVKADGKIGYLKSPILHYADPTFSRYLQRWDRYTSLDAQLLFKEKKNLNFFIYFFIKPKVWFFKTYFLHKGFMDGFPGFVFCLFSSIRFWLIYVKWWQKKHLQI